jgi:hypothetical protein
MLLGDVPDELLDDDGLADAGTAEDPDLAALLERADQVDHLDPGLEDLHVGGLLVERGRGTMDRQDLGAVDRALTVDRVPKDVEDPAQRHRAHRHGDRGAGVADLGAACQAVGGGHRHRPDPVVAQVLLHLADERVVVRPHNLHRVVDLRQPAGGELDVDDGPGDLDHAAGRGGSGGRHGWCRASCA